MVTFFRRLVGALALAFVAGVLVTLVLPGTNVGALVAILGWPLPLWYWYRRRSHA